MDSQHSQRATRALVKLAPHDPAFASLSLWCHHRDAKPMDAVEIATDDAGNVTANPVKTDFAAAYTDGKTVFYGEQFEKWSLEEQMAVCSHELLHVSFCHILRGKKLADRLGSAYRPKVFNIATDALINAMLSLAGYRLPQGVVDATQLFKEVFNERVTLQDVLGNYTAEQLYFKIMDHIPEAPSASCAQQGSGDGQGGAQSGAGQSGAEAAENYADGAGFKPDLDEAGANMSPAEAAQTQAEWQERLTRAFQAGQMAGRGIGTLGHKIADIPKSTTPWEVVLRRLVSKAVTRTPQQSFARPTRRWLGMDSDARDRGLVQPAYEPGMIKQSDHPKIVVGVDVSGSISDRILETFAGEISAIGRRTAADIHLMVFDTQVLNEVVLDGTSLDSEIRKVEFARGGGTSFVDVIDKAAALDPSIIVVLTDLHGPFGDAPKGVPVVWATPEHSADKAPFGRILPIGS